MPEGYNESMAATRRPVKPQEPKTAEEVAALAPKGEKMPSIHELGGELEALAAAAGRYWRALGEAGLPPGFRTAMFDNWQKSYWDAEDEDDATSVDDDTEEGFQEE